jgi:adenosylmethionine-8-amino-7-oxononanoate aminotransferase
MLNKSNFSLSERDAKIIWHPFTQHQIEPICIPIVSGKGSELIDENGKVYLDAISSWWVNIHGHAHPYLAEKIYEQALQLEQVIFAGFTHAPAIQLAERLLGHLPPNFEKVFFSDNGSTAIEVAVKMALQYFHNLGQTSKRKILALEGAYHGDTFGAMSLGAPSLFNAPFQDMLFEVEFLPNPCDSETCVAELKNKMQKAEDYAAFIFEPLIQGAGGMNIYDAATLNDLIQIAQQNNVLCIADEIMTGFGRTGRWFAMDYLSTKPDIACFSKGLTGGMMALGATCCSEKLFDAFLSNDRKKTLFHSHSFTANPLACAAANASMDLMEDENTWRNIERIQLYHQLWMEKLSSISVIKNARQLGTIIAFEIETGETNSYTHSIRDIAYQFFIEKGILMRPLGNTLYILAPYCIKNQELDLIYQTIEDFTKTIIR